ncbi:S-adenosyl-L-methionine-dependent methyltransferase [Cadophora sp. DSE1049]|nr:S-adenosyl-L-methionine-dependent methyltransferase [Cadophora sp. DSE1049]
MQLNRAGCPYDSQRPPEHKEELSRKEVDSMAGGSWSGGSTIAGSEAGPKWEHSRSGVEDSTTTLSSEAFKPIEKYGRGYHCYHEGKYLLPNDEQERERLDLQHHLFGITLGGRLHLARLPTTQRALDIGTGTGIWSIDFADEHPGVEVYGVDLSPIQPEWIPPNCIFQIDDLSLPWTLEFPFDFIHGRMLFCSFSNPLHVFREAFKALTAGGVVEMQDPIFEFRSPDGSLEGSALETWAKKVKEAFGSKGIDLTSASRYRNYLEAVGFEDIQQQEFIWPVGTWPNDQHFKTLGWWCRANILDMLFAISIVPLTEHQQHSMSEEAVQLLLARVREDLRDPKIHAYLQIVVVHGRKPKPDIPVVRSSSTHPAPPATDCGSMLCMNRVVAPEHCSSRPCSMKKGVHRRSIPCGLAPLVPFSRERLFRVLCA